MLKNYFIIAWRNIRKQPVFSVINIAGLSIGLAAFWLIALYIGDELSFDRYHKKGDRIYRVVQHASWKESGFHLAPTSAPFAPTLKAEYPEVEAAVRINPEGGGVIIVGDKSIQAGDVMFADNSIFSVFTYKFIAGNPSNALAAPQTIVITRSLAETLFGDAGSALGKSLYFENKFPNTVSAVIEDLPANSHFRFRGLRSLPAGYTAGWQAFELYTYILLKKGTDVNNLESKLPAFFKKHLEPSMGQGIDYRMELQPLSSIHLYSNLEYEMAANGNIQYVYVFSIIGLLVLIIASINYMNLSTARASYRVKEIGVRKVIGSGKSQLVFMFLAESVLICLFAGGLAILIAELVMPLFNQLSGKELSIWRFGMPVTLLMLFAFTVVTGLISGIYPAFFMSGFLMIPSLKGQIGSRTGTALFRKGLVTFQFVITIMMIAGSYIVYQQLNYIQNKNLGLNKDQVLTFHIDNDQLREKTAAIKEAFLRNPLIESVAAASNPIGNNNIGSNGIFFEEESKLPGEAGNISTSTRKTQNFMVDGDYLKTLEIGLVAGRNYSEQRKGDQASSILVNETLVKELGWKQPIGKKVRYYVNNEGKLGESIVVGVVKDFHIYSLQHKLEPLILQMPQAEMMKDNLYVKVSSKNIPAALAYLKKTYLQFDPSANPEFRFLSENFNAQYKSEQKQGSLLLVLTVIAISIACLGLFGLVTFTAVQKSKEIGIRKVLGASVAGIVKLLSIDLLKLVAIAFIIATPIAWIAMKYWLQDFAYQIKINWTVFLIAGGTALLIALITLSIQAIRSALANPVKSLKAE
ncbi:ABC transporter permease [Flavitalea sp.]|nr:ABC transporter permease [Flavitalea sp.]